MSDFIIDAKNLEDISRYVGVVNLDTNEVLREIDWANITCSQYRRVDMTTGITEITTPLVDLPDDENGYKRKRPARLAALTAPDADGVQYLVTGNQGYEHKEVWKA
jgi:hypothetical protein